MLCGGIAVIEQACAFQDHIDTEITPGQLARVAFGKHFYAIAIDYEVTAFNLDFAGKLSVSGVETCQVSIGLGVAKIVQRNDLEFGGAARLVQRAQDVSTDAAISIDADFDCHLYSLLAGRRIAGPVNCCQQD
jgi:hypothetical protein